MKSSVSRTTDTQREFFSKNLNILANLADGPNKLCFSLAPSKLFCHCESLIHDFLFINLLIKAVLKAILNITNLGLGRTLGPQRIRDLDIMRP